LDDPNALIGYPVFDSFDKDRQVAGVLITNIYWGLFFRNILPPSAVGYICVIENSYGQTLSYRVDGKTTRYLGEVDPHDSKYDNMK